MDTLEYIYGRFRIDKSSTDSMLNKAAKSPIEVVRSREGAFPRLINNLNFKVGAEIGVASGYFSRHLCHYCPNFKLYSVDAWELFGGCTKDKTQKDMDKLYEIARGNLTGLNCQIIRDWSMNAVKRFADESLDFVYIDAAHDYKNVYNDIKEWSKKVRMGGIIGGHDYMDPNFDGKKDYYKEIYDVKAAVNDWVKANNINPLFVLTKVNCRSWFYVKT